MNRLLLAGFLSVTFFAPLLAQGDVPPTPKDLIAEQVDGTGPLVKLAWSAPFGPWGLKVYRSEGNSAEYRTIGVTGQRFFLDHSVTAGTKYNYYVTSVTISRPDTVIHESPPSNIASITVGGPSGLSGVIEGTVTDDSTDKPIPYVLIRFFRKSSRWNWMPHALTDSLGRYSAKLDTGTYLILAQPLVTSHNAPSYVPEWYDNAPTPETATPVKVEENSTFVADFGLRPLKPVSYAFISGTVTDDEGNPLPDALVVIMRPIQELFILGAKTGIIPGLGDEAMDIEGVGHCQGVVWRGYTDSEGRYRARVILGGRYIALGVKRGYIPEFYDNKENPKEADIIHVTGDISGIDFSLSPRPTVQNSISGIVRDALGVRVPARIILLPAHPFPIPRHVRFGHTNEMGEYAISEVHEGEYLVLAIPFSGYAPAFYKKDAYGIIHWKDADIVKIVGNVTGIDIGVVPMGSPGLAQLSGTVRSTSGGQPVTGASVFATTTVGAVVGYGLTDATGSYTIEAVPVGTVNLDIDREEFNASQGTVNVAATTFRMNNINFVISPVSSTSVNGHSGTPVRYSLAQNYPNPFNPSTAIRYDIPVNSAVTIKIFNVLGQEIVTLVNGNVAAGTHELEWSGKDNSGRSVASGIYFYRINAKAIIGGEEYSSVRKMVLLE